MKNETVFNVSNRMTVFAHSERTRYGFRHVATLYLDGVENARAVATYYNRTWERYTFETVLFSLHEKASLPSVGLSHQLYRYIKQEDERTADDMKPLRAIAAVARLGEILAPDQTSANDWKARMLRAGLEGRGLIMPDDWATLSEDEKQRRLDGAIKQLS